MLKNPARLLETEILVVKSTMNHLKILSRLIFCAALAIAMLLMGIYPLQDSPDSNRQTQLMDFEVQPNVRLFVGVI